jgi:hypothetical protein
MMQTRWLLLGITLAHCVVFAFSLVSAAVGNPGLIRFQESGEASSDNTQRLIGHWRKTTIVFESPKDEHLVLHADGTAENWVVTAESRSEPVSGRWSVKGKTLTLSFGENENSKPFTFYQGQLVFPNIPNRRGFWEKIQ